MAKKYLLYIHDDRFETEPKKSELINRLLEKHYGGLIRNIKLNNDGTLSPKVIGEKTVIKTRQDAEEAVRPLMKDDKWGGPLFRNKKIGRL